ncbi:TPA: hypothetical protein ACFNMI_001043 [Neisseria bacilliformis]|nr:hypothetical protein [Neisseria bacilliformis]
MDNLSEGRKGKGGLFCKRRRGANGRGQRPSENLFFRRPLAV